MKRNDLLTNEEFIPLRINQRFISPQNRIKYYNNKANALRHKVSYVNIPLHKNLKILNELLENKKEATYHKQFLLGKSFDFRFHTHYAKLGDKSHFAIYQYIILNEPNEQIKIISTND